MSTFRLQSQRLITLNLADPLRYSDLDADTLYIKSCSREGRVLGRVLTSKPQLGPAIGARMTVFEIRPNI